MYHSITFTDGQNSYNTWDDWHLIPSSRPVVAQSGVSTNFVAIPGKRDGSIDASEYLTGDIVYTSRSGNFNFIVDNDHEDWITLYERIVTSLHGKHMSMILEDDPEYYYEGRFTVGEWQSGSYNSKVTINYALQPYKYLIDAGQSSNEGWL